MFTLGGALLKRDNQNCPVPLSFPTCKRMYIIIYEKGECKQGSIGSRNERHLINKVMLHKVKINAFFIK